MMQSHAGFKNLHIIALIAILAASPSEASQTPMGIGEAIDIMLANNSSLLSLRHEMRKAEAFEIQSEGTFTPDLALSAAADDERTNQTSGGTSQVRLSASQTLYSGGRNQALRRQSGQVRSIAELTLADAENRAVGELFARFYNVLLQDRYAETERSAIAASELHLREVARMSELGLSNRLEVIRASQQLAANRANLSSAEGLYDSAVISLMNYLAIPPEERRPAAGSLITLEAAGGRELSLSEAMKNRADLGVLENQAEYQANQIEIERSASRPRITLGGAVSFFDRERSGNFDDTWRTELSITVPILDRNASRGNVIRAQATAAQDKIALRQKELDIKSGVETAWTELETAAEHLEASAKALELAEETLRLAGIGFQEGVTPQLDLLSAQTSLTESRLGHLRSLYNHMLAVIALKVTEGNIIAWAEEMEFQ
ncbi:MAG: TolC family protein [Synergistaceae bacterium]|jgi:outer membrane protein TolC|nr:TolC family protein [Synergistaceae bacterium]